MTILRIVESPFGEITKRLSENLKERRFSYAAISEMERPQVLDGFHTLKTEDF